MRKDTTGMTDTTVEWLLTGDVSIQYQVHRYLLESDEDVSSSLQERIVSEGWGSHFLACQHPNGQWGNYYYQPKWTSTHYTLLDLRNLEVSPSTAVCREMVSRLFTDCMDTDGSLNLSKSKIPSDICVDQWFSTTLLIFVRKTSAIASWPTMYCYSKKQTEDSPGRLIQIMVILIQLFAY